MFSKDNIDTDGFAEVLGDAETSCGFQNYCFILGVLPFNHGCCQVKDQRTQSVNCEFTLSHEESETEEGLEVDFGDGESKAEHSLQMIEKLPKLPDDAIYGDGGAYQLISDVEDLTHSTAAPKQRPVDSVDLPSLQGHKSFSSMLSASQHKFSMGTCTVELALGLNDHSKSNVAFLYNAVGERLGVISTAEALGTTRGLKASCDVHKMKGTKPCVCWIVFPKKKVVSDSDRWDLFMSLASWVESGADCNREQHLNASYTLRVASGMKPRLPGAPAEGEGMMSQRVSIFFVRHNDTVVCVFC